MAQVTGSQLQLIAKILDLPQEQLSGITDMDMGSISLVFNVAPEILRRGVQLGPQGGWFMGILENVHSGADGERSEIDPYAAGADAVAPFPTTVPEDIDLWLLGVSLVQSVGTGTLLTAAQILFNPAPFTQGFGRDDGGLPIIAVRAFTVARFTSVVNDVTDLGAEAGITDQGLTYQPVNMRIPRGSTISFSSESSAAAEFQAILVMGMFPASLGQDVVT